MAQGLSPLNGIDPSAILQMLQGAMGQTSDAQTSQAQLAAQQAQGQANQAGQDYSNAAAAPAQSLSNMASFLPNLLGNVASVMSGRPQYAQEAQQSVASTQGDLAQKRKDNLKALADKYDRAAMAAKDAGHVAAEMEARTKLEGIHRSMETLNKTISEAGLNQRAAAGNTTKENVATIGANAKTTAATTAANARIKTAGSAAGGDESIAPEVYTNANGNKFLDLTNFKGVKETNAARDYAARQGIPAVDPKNAQVLKDVDNARSNLKGLMSDLDGLLPADPQQRIAGFGQRRLSQILQTNEARAAYQTNRDGLFQQIRTLGVSGRLNQQEIKIAVANLPTLNDTYGVANRKIEILNRLFDNKERPILTRNWQAAPKTVRMQKGGQFFQIPADQVKDAVKDGLVRAS